MKTAHFDANCMKIGFLILKILQFYFFKMPTNGGRHFEMPLKLKIIKLNKFLKSIHSFTPFNNVIYVYYENNHFMGYFYKYYTFINIIGKKSISTVS